MRTQLTARQKEILDFIREFTRESGYPPTMREIGGHFGFLPRAATNHVNALVRKGYLSKQPLKSRSLIVTGLDHSSPSRHGLDRHGLREVPIVGRVAAGEPILAIENIEGAVMLPRGWAQGDDCFLLRVEGDSMVDAHICSGDYVLVKRRPTAENNEIVVALLGDEATVKRIIIKKDRIVLKPENKQMEPINIKSGDKSFRVIGKVIGVWRSI